jgi:hypothetical protein
MMNGGVCKRQLAAQFDACHGWRSFEVLKIDFENCLPLSRMAVTAVSPRELTDVSMENTARSISMTYLAD